MAVKSHETDVRCISCADHLALGQEAYLATVSYSVPKENGVQEFPVIDEDGDFRYKPYFFDLACWTEVDDGLKETLEDERPVAHDDCCIECDYCESHILPFEVYARIRFGEMQRSSRCPPGRTPYQFMQIGSRTWAMCLSCMAYVFEQTLEIWEDVTQSGECATCQHARCWRGDDCTLECPCHEEREEEEEEEEEDLYERGDCVSLTNDFIRHVTGLNIPTRGTVQTDQQSGEEEVDVLWNDGTRSRINYQNIELVG